MTFLIVFLFHTWMCVFRKGMQSKYTLCSLRSVTQGFLVIHSLTAV